MLAFKRRKLFLHEPKVSAFSFGWWWTVNGVFSWAALQKSFFCRNFTFPTNTDKLNFNPQIQNLDASMEIRTFEEWVGAFAFAVRLLAKFKSWYFAKNRGMFHQCSLANFGKSLHSRCNTFQDFWTQHLWNGIIFGKMSLLIFGIPFSLQALSAYTCSLQISPAWCSGSKSNAIQSIGGAGSIEKLNCAGFIREACLFPSGSSIFLASFSALDVRMFVFIVSIQVLLMQTTKILCQSNWLLLGQCATHTKSLSFFYPLFSIEKKWPPQFATPPIK